MKVLLLNPPPVRGIRYTREGRCQEKEGILGSIKPPLTLLYIASIARDAGNEAVLIDANAKRLGNAEVSGSISRMRPDAIFISTSTPTVDSDFECIPQDYPGIVIAIGAFAKAMPEYVFSRHRSIKAIAYAEPELVALRLFRAMGDLRKVKGIVLRDGGDANAPESADADIGSLPEPAWDLLDFDDYRLPNNNERYAMVELGRGCPHDCNFCVTGMVHGKRMRYRPAGKVIAEMRDLKERYGISHFYLLADSPFSKKGEMAGFLRSLISADLKIRWMSNARLDTIDEEIGGLLRESGCWLLAVGVESGSELVRKGMGKRLSAGDARKGMRILKKNKIDVLAFYIFGAAGETRESAEDTMRLALELDATYSNFYPAVPYPGTGFFSFCEKEGFLASKDFSRYDYSDFVIDYKNGVDRDFVLAKKREAYLRFYLRPGKMLKLLSKMPIQQALRCSLNALRDG